MSVINNHTFNCLIKDVMKSTDLDFTDVIQVVDYFLCKLEIDVTDSKQVVEYITAIRILNQMLALFGILDNWESKETIASVFKKADSINDLEKDVVSGTNPNRLIKFKEIRLKMYKQNMSSSLLEIIEGILKD